MPTKKAAPKKTARKTAAKKTTAKKAPAKKKATTKKTVAKKKPAAKKKAPAKKTTAKKKAPAKQAAPKKMTAVKTAYTKSATMNAVSEMTGLSKKDVTAVMDALKVVIHGHLKKGAVGKFVWPGVAKFEAKKKPSRPARWGVNPFTGEKMKFKAKPASVAVKIKPLKDVKEMVS